MVLAGGCDLEIARTFLVLARWLPSEIVTFLHSARIKSSTFLCLFHTYAVILKCSVKFLKFILFHEDLFSLVVQLSKASIYFGKDGETNSANKATN